MITEGDLISVKGQMCFDFRGEGFIQFMNWLQRNYEGDCQAIFECKQDDIETDIENCAIEFHNIKLESARNSHVLTLEFDCEFERDLDLLITEFGDIDGFIREEIVRKIINLPFTSVFLVNTYEVYVNGNATDKYGSTANLITKKLKNTKTNSEFVKQFSQLMPFLSNSTIMGYAGIDLAKSTDMSVEQTHELLNLIEGKMSNFLLEDEEQEEKPKKQRNKEIEEKQSFNRRLFIIKEGESE